MKFVIFDGILETHVASSLERALIRRGHQVLNTGKIGMGFKFPAAGQDLSILEITVSRAVAFNPDVVFVMRPCSLPPRLFRKLEKTGATMIAWFSDDPVLFDLSYGPVVDLYDLVLHCGNKQVLEFYEDRFGRPTGVNFPFWTDNIAFPKVWGSKEPTVDFMFLGNVQDEVRRARYFELSALEQSIRVHGNVASDYFGISGGYLDGDSEVVSSGSTAKMAINIPQFFVNHKGLETWFTGLSSLGFFEYPSRVIQYMAMGIPTVSIIPEKPTFRSYPEMLVVEDIRSAGRLFLEIEPDLTEISQKVSSRFDRNFSANSRVQALESLLKDDSWKALSSDEREIWFTQFDGRNGSEICTNADLQKDREVISVRTDTGKVLETRYLVCANFSAGGYWSRPRAIANTLAELGEVELLDAEAIPQILVPDPGKTCDKAVNVSAINWVEEQEGSNFNCVLVVVGENLALTASGRQYLQKKGVSAVLVDDSPSLTRAQQMRQLEGFDLVCYGNEKLGNEAIHRGFQNAAHLSYFPDPEFVKAAFELEMVPGRVIRLREKAQVEEVAAPCFVYDLPSGNEVEIIELESLAELSAQEAVEKLYAESALISYGGSRNNPSLFQAFINAAAVCRIPFFSRHPMLDKISPMHKVCKLVSNTGELSVKFRQFLNGDLDPVDFATRKARELENLENGVRDFQRKLEALSTDDRLASAPLRKGVFIAVSPTNEGSFDKTNSAYLSIACKYWYGNIEDWWLRIRVNGQAIHGEKLTSTKELFIRMPINERSIQIEVEYLGKSQPVDSSNALSLNAYLRPSKSIYAGHPGSSKVVHV